MTIRSKLIVMLTVPVVALAIVAIWAFRDVNTDSEVLEDSAVAVVAISELDTLWSDLSQERLVVFSEREAASRPFAGGGDLTEIIAQTDATLERLSSQTTSGADVFAQAVTEVLPTNRRNVTTQEYSDALDIVEAGIAEQSLTGLEADSVLRAIFMDDAREASRLHEEAWINILGTDELDEDQIRALLTSSRDTVAARQQSFTARLSDGTRPFADAAAAADTTNLGELEGSFAVQSAFSGEGVSDIVNQAVGQLSDQEILISLLETRADWNEASENAQMGLRMDVSSNISSVDETRSLAIFVALLGSFLLFTLMFVVGRSITGPLNRLMQNAEVVTHDRLPAAVAQLRTLGASDDDVELAPIPKESNDEIGTITDAFNDIQTSALRVATDQARSRRNVAEMFVSLGRRNQQLNQRLISMISEMEQDEQDPETLKSLYNLDNVATRMRRNAESLLVLAGNRSPRQWSKPVQFADVVRSALAEVEFFERVEVGELPEIAMAGNVVADVTHMFAEVLDNATQFSDPTTTVNLSGYETAVGVRLEIEDSGFGIHADDLARLNERLSNPPELDKAPSRLLGLFVVGRLAEQHEIDVTLVSEPGEGTVAIIDIPHNHFPAEVGENPIDVSAPPVELNADNAASFFESQSSGDDAGLPIDVDGSEDLPIDTHSDDEEPAADLEPVAEVNEPEPVVATATDELPSREVETDELPTREVEIDELPSREVEATAVEDEDDSESGSFNPLKGDNWPLAQPDPLPTREERPMEAVQREAQQELAESAVDETDSPEAVEVTPIEEVEEAAPSSDGGSGLAGLPTRMPQATIEAAATDTAVIPLDIETPAVESAGSAAPSAFGSFVQGVQAGLEDVNKDSDEGEDS